MTALSESAGVEIEMGTDTATGPESPTFRQRRCGDGAGETDSHAEHARVGTGCNIADGHEGENCNNGDAPSPHVVGRPSPLAREETPRTELVRSSRSLPDLKQRIVDLGLYPAYSRFREGYLRWRRGYPHDFHGELSAETLGRLPPLLHSQDDDSLEDLSFPTFTAWQWRRTTSYWIAITFLEGSILLAVSSACGSTSPERFGAYRNAIIKWTALVGSGFFVFGAYLMCLETMNLNRPKMRYWPIAFGYVLGRKGSHGDATRLPYITSISYFIGALLFLIASGASLVAIHSRAAIQFFIVAPQIVGGLLFVCGGICECVENKVVANRFERRLCWWAAVANCVGGVFFFAASLAAVLSDFVCNLLTTFGCVFFLVGSMLSVVMWMDNKFGLTYMSVFNQDDCPTAEDTPKDAGDVSEVAGGATPLSLTAVIFLYFYCFVADIALFDTCVELEVFISDPTFFHMTLVYNELLPFLLMHLVLVMQSALVKVPKRQPYRFLIIMVRFLSVITALNTFIVFCLRLQGRSRYNISADAVQSFLAQAKAGHGGVTSTFKPDRAVG
eukprot:TRINITY_DN74831_c0_g1_i1.p1 TRINITY_DN74831_c0_g1~~TRINITY_DN74831_c0_g1_i1.p1  ORF type:complete len:558 (+),score=59.49 TRINITY_DN74831_c0_g1_i1:105-1778(+)